MSTTYARVDFSGDNIHQRDGSLLKRKQEQWAKERACTDSWFPFGSPGGGAPNRKHDSPNFQLPEKTENRSPSRRSNGDSGRWSGSENVGQGREEVDIVSRGLFPPCPFGVPSTSTMQPTMYIPQPSQVIIEGSSSQSLPQVGSPASAHPAVAPSGVPIPMQFIYTSNSCGQPVPVPVEIVQPQSTGMPFAYPVRLIPSTSTSCQHQQNGTSEGVRAELPVLASSYTEHWANQLPYWGPTAVRGEESSKPMSAEAACVGLPPILSAQPLAVVRPMVIPVMPSVHSIDQQFSPAQPSASADEMARKSMSESMTSLNSSSRRSAEYDNKVMAKQTEQYYSEQIAEKRQAENQRLEAERREAYVKELERRKMEASEREKEFDEERKKAKAEEERARMEAALMESIEKAKREAAMLRKARIFRHVLEDPEKNSSLEHRILGDDEEKNMQLLKEVENLERQKKYDMEKVGGTGRVSEKKIDSTKDSGYSKFNGSFDDERPIQVGNGWKKDLDALSAHLNDEEQLKTGFSRRGRQSMRVRPSPKDQVKRRSDSAERSSQRSDNDSVEQGPGTRRRTLSQCTIPVRLQKRIPPPTPRSRRASTNENLESPNNLKKEVEELGMVVSHEPLNIPVQLDRPKKINVCETKPIFDDPTKERLAELLPNLKLGLSEDYVELPSVLPLLRPRRSSLDAVTAMSDNSGPCNPLFQPVATRCRRTRLLMGNSDIPRASSSSGSGSPPPLSAEDEIISPPAQKTSCGSSDKREPVTPPKLNRPAATKLPVPAGDFTSETRSPFKRSLDETANANRRREEELLSPEIRRKGEFPNSTRLRTSMASLAVEDSDDGRASPVSPLIQRFNSKTSQYRSLNLKKTSERNQKVLDQLAQLREQLRQKQIHMENTFAPSKVSPLTRSRTTGAVSTVASKSREPVTAI